MSPSWTSRSSGTSVLSVTQIVPSVRGRAGHGAAGERLAPALLLVLAAARVAPGTRRVRRQHRRTGGRHRRLLGRRLGQGSRRTRSLARRPLVGRRRLAGTPTALAGLGTPGRQ